MTHELSARVVGSSRVLGVWGWPVSHSRSPQMHNAAIAELQLPYVYVPFAVSPENIRDAVSGLRALDIAGVNVTVPLKELVIPCLDWVSNEAQRVRAVNTIVNDNGYLRGYSTDGQGFMLAIEDWGEDAGGRDVLLLGAGGSARSVAYALVERGTKVWVSNRTPESAVRLVDELNAWSANSACTCDDASDGAHCTLVVNATSAGMSPHAETMAQLPKGLLEHRPAVYDLVYAPRETTLLRVAREAGCRTENGLKMLIYQGALALQLWTDLPFARMPVGAMYDAANRYDEPRLLNVNRQMPP